MDKDGNIHVRLEKYSRFDGLKKKWICELDTNLSLKICHGVLLVLIDYRILESVFILDKENVKIAVKDRVLVVAYANQQFITRFRVIFQSDELSTTMIPVVNYINNYNPVIKDITYIQNGRKTRKCSSVLCKTSSSLEESGVKFKEIPLDGLKDLMKFGVDDENKLMILNLILDPKFLQYMLMIKNMSSKKEKSPA